MPNIQHRMINIQPKRLTRTASILIACIAVLFPPSSAQQNPSATNTSAFQSDGIKATITSISLANNKIIIQFSIQNLKQTDVAVALISGYGGSSGTLMATNGAVYKMDFREISGMSSCNDGTSRPSDDQAQTCVKQPDPNNMTTLEPGKSGILGIIYTVEGQPASQTDKVNFVLKFLVRSATASKPEPPRLITISFPLIPLSS